MISETPTLSSRTRHTSTKKRSSCYVGAFVMYSPSGADGSANTKQGCNRSCAASTGTSGKAGDVAVSPPNLLATVNQFGRANLGSPPNAAHAEGGQTSQYKRFVDTNPTGELITSGLSRDPTGIHPQGSDIEEVLSQSIHYMCRVIRG